MMDSVDVKQFFLSRLEQLKRDSCTDATSPSAMADVHRSLYLHLKSGNGTALDNFDERSAFNDEAVISLKKYTDVVDCMEESGLNNFAEGALALCSHHKNESSKWDTGLQVEDILQMPCFQDLMEEKEAAFVGDPDIPLIRDPKNRPSSGPHLDDNANVNGRNHSSSMSSGNSPLNRLKENANVFGNDCTHHQQEPCNVNWKNQQDRRNHPNPPKTTPSPFQPTETSKRPSFARQTEDNSNKNLQSANPSGGKFSFRSQYKQAGRGYGSSARDANDEAQRDLEVNPNKYGGPFANFGQKHKVQNNAMAGNQRNVKPWQRQGAKEEDDNGADEETRPTPFKTAKQQFIINQKKKFGRSAEASQVSSVNYGSVKKSLGTRRGPASRFVPPVLNRDSDEADSPSFAPGKQSARRDEEEEPTDERLKGIDPKMIELINNEIMDHGADIAWSDIAGLDFAKKTIKEIVVWPMLRPDIFTGLRGPPKGLLLFGPPGTGKTLIGKCIASQSKSTFFCISASSLTSKWVGEGEKMVRALFAVARCNQPAVVFIDEIDSLLSQRSDGEHESSRRIKTEFLVQLDGAATGSEDRILVIGATNRPQEIDEAARRRFVKRLLIPLPEGVARKQIVVNLMSQQNCQLEESDVEAICEKTDGYSGADMSNLCREAALGPIRSIPMEMMETITPEQVRPILLGDFNDAMRQVRASVSPKDLELYLEWNKTYGSFGH